MKKLLNLLLAIVLAVALAAGCAAQSAPEDTSQSAAPTAVPKDLMDENVDALGETAAPVDTSEALTIVSTAPSATEILFALGCGENIVGVDIYSTYPEETANIEKVGDFNGFDIEKVISLNPGVVFAGNGLQQEQIAQLKDAGLNVVAAEATYYEDIAASITLIGATVGKEAEAASLNEQIASVAASVQQKAAEFEQKPSVYYVMGIGDYGNWTSGEGSFINWRAAPANGSNTRWRTS